MLHGSAVDAQHVWEAAVEDTRMCGVQTDWSDSCKVVSINCMSLRNAHDIHRSILSRLLDKPSSASAKQAAADVERYVTTSKSMMLVLLYVMVTPSRCVTSQLG